MADIIKEYILNCPDKIQGRLFQLKNIIEETIPEATPRIAWKMPTYTVDETNIIHFSVQKNFISLHVGIDTVSFFKDRLTGYSTTKSTVHFAFEDEIPSGLIREMISCNLFK